MEFIIFILIVVVVAIVVRAMRPKVVDVEGERKSYEPKHTSPYHYGRKKYLMTQSENSFFKLLVLAVGNDVNVFPQVRLSALLYRAKGIEQRYWRAALARINQKSIDYVLCNKITGEILLLIELDDPTHDTAVRIKRDGELNEILQEAGMPLLRFRNLNNLTHEIVRAHIYELLPHSFGGISKDIALSRSGK